MKFILYLIAAVLCFFLAEGIMYTFYDHWGEIPPWWAFPLAFIISSFLLPILILTLFFLVAIGRGLLIWIGEKWKNRRKG